MPYMQQPYRGAADWERMAALAQRYPARHLHAIDLPYRFSS